jgi:P4 family phage/plasmid primase-like protien
MICPHCGVENPEVHRVSVRRDGHTVFEDQTIDFNLHPNCLACHENMLEQSEALQAEITEEVNHRLVLVPNKLADLIVRGASVGGSALEVRTFRDNDQIVTYDKVENPGYWNLNGKRVIREVAHKLVEAAGLDVVKLLGRNVFEEVLFHIRCVTGIDRKDFREADGLLCLENGAFDLQTRTLERHSSENRFLWRLPVQYDPAASCPLIDKFLRDVLGERADLGYEIAGYIICEAQNRMQRAFMFLGPGDNGKSTLLQLLTALIGSENISHIELQSLSENRFAAAQLHGKLANFAADVSDRALVKTSMFKSLTGGDDIGAEHKFCDPFTFRPRAKLVYSCNSLAETYDDSDAFFKRWVIALFEQTFTGDKCDRDILSKLVTPQELSGFANKAIEAYRHVVATGRFTGEGDTSVKRDLYVRLSDPVQCFIEERVLINPDGQVKKQLLYSTFQGYCQEKGYGKHFTQKRFFRKFREKAGEQLVESWTHDSDGTKHRIYRGIQLDLETLTLKEAAQT